jgi:hypothetical protein
LNCITPGFGVASFWTRHIYPFQPHPGPPQIRLGNVGFGEGVTSTWVLINFFIST